MTKVYATDIALLQGLSNGEREAMKEVYQRYHKTLIQWIVNRGGKTEDAEDVFQEGIMVLYDKSKDSEFVLSASIGTFLFGICKRIWFKKSRNSASIVNVDFEDEEQGMEVRDSYSEDLELFLEKESQLTKLSQCLDQLGSPCSNLLKAFYIEQKSMQDIALAFGYTNADNAKTQKYKCLNRLKRIFFS